MKRPSPGVLVLAGAVVITLTAAWGLARRPFPKETAEPPPAAGFVGSETCAHCHAQIAETQKRSGHAATLARVQQRTRLKGSSWKKDPVVPTLARIARHGSALGVEVKAGEVTRWQPAQFLFGSGRHGLTPVADAGAGRYMELPLSYYPARGWDFTPGYLMYAPQRRMYHPAGVPADHSLFFTCFNCHATGVLDREDSLDLSHMRMGIQCERCHGPGEAHVHAAEQHRSAAGTLRNAPGQSAAAVSAFCGECHRTQSPAFLKPDAPALVRFAPVGLGRSRCFRESAGRLSCLSCHDPHQDTEPNPQRVEAVCRSCHDAGHGAKSCPTNKVSGCVACHMPKVEAAPHSFFTDHWIRPRRDPGVPPPASHQVFGLRRPAKG